MPPGAGHMRDAVQLTTGRGELPLLSAHRSRSPWRPRKERRDQKGRRRSRDAPRPTQGIPRREEERRVRGGG